jgi:hypothetical protein
VIKIEFEACISKSGLVKIEFARALNESEKGRNLPHLGSGSLCFARLPFQRRTLKFQELMQAGSLWRNIAFQPSHFLRFETNRVRVGRA